MGSSTTWVASRTPSGSTYHRSAHHPGRIASAVVDTAHRLARLYLDAGDHAISSSTPAAEPAVIRARPP
jgi:hypothetical protein